MKKKRTWKHDIVLSLVVIIGFAIIDDRISVLSETIYYYQFLMTAKWLLVGGFTIHGIIDWMSSRQD